MQGFFTELGNDECYYWMYSQNLDWGYFDHPPVVAVIISMGYTLFSNELGVRFMTILLSALVIWLLWELLPTEEKKRENSKLVFIMLVASSPLLHIYGFITTPDVPLIFFAILFMYVYKLFIEKESWGKAVLLGLVMAAMAYSKYHGALVVIFILLSNPKLLLNPKIYVAGLIAAFLLIPHLLWQYNHDFASFQYHLSGRHESFKWESLWLYPINTLLVLNPLLSPILFYRLPGMKSENLFERSLKFLFWGFIVFFAFSAFKSHVEPHWIAIVIVPTIFFLFKIFTTNTSRYFKITSYITIGILLVARIILALPLNTHLEFHGGKKRAQSIEKIAGDRPVVFYNSFRHPSRYTFYTGKPAFGYTSVFYHPTQYDFWNFEDKYEGKKVVLALNYTGKGCETKILEDGSKFRYYEIDTFHFYDKLQIDYPDSIVAFKNGEWIEMDLEITNPYTWDVDFKGEYPLKINAVFRRNTRVFGNHEVQCKLPEILKSGETVQVHAKFKTNVPPNEYHMLFGFTNERLVPFYNSKQTTVEIQ